MWKLDDIDFKDYGVGVRKSTGVLDLPKIIDKGQNWLDADGVDFWQDAADLRYDEHEIVLSCWLKSTTYSAFKTACNTFYTALQGSGLRSLSTPFGVTIDCYLEKEIEMARKTSYLSQYQVGLFTLRLTVPGTGDYNLITIKRYIPGTGVIYPAIVKSKNLVIRKDLQGDSVLTIDFESNTKLDIQRYDWIDYEYPGDNSDRFFLTGPPKFVKKSTNKFQYNLTFKFYGFALMERPQFLNDLYEAEFEYYANVEEILDHIIWNYERNGYGTGQFTKGTVVSTLRKNHKFNGENCLEVLKRIVAEYKLEFEFVKNNPSWWNYTINIKEQVANDKAITFEYGKGKGLYELSRGERIEDGYFTRLFAFGSSKNLPVGYRSGLRRLSFDENPLGESFDKEVTMFFDDIFPQRTSTVTAYAQILEADLTAAQKEVWPNGIFKITDSSLDFDINDYLLANTTAKIVMKTGDLAGYEFGISKYDNATKEIYIIPYQDERGELLPNAILKITGESTPGAGDGDEYTLVNIDMPATYLTEAEALLKATAEAEYAYGIVERFEYTCVVDPKFIIDNNLYIEVGDRFTLVDTDYSLDGLRRISRLTYNDYTGKYELSFAETIKKSRIAKIERVIEEIEDVIENTGLDEVEVIRDNVTKPDELSRKLLDPAGRLNTDTIVRPGSIDPGMISLDTDANVYANVLIELNVDGYEDRVSLQAGTLTVTNFNTKNRYEIQKLKSGGGTYDPTRTWVIPATDIELPTKDPYVLYAKLDLTEGSTACVIEAHAEHVEGKLLIEDGYLYKRLLPITGGEES